MSGLVLIAGGTVFACAAGFYLRGRTVRSPRAVLGGVLAVLAVLLAAGLVLTLLPAPSAAAEATAASAASGLGFLGASPATGLAGLGAGGSRCTPPGRPAPPGQGKGPGVPAAGPRPGPSRPRSPQV